MMLRVTFVLCALFCPLLLAATVTIPVGSDAQSIVNANPAGTTYSIASGVHQYFSVRPKSNDKYPSSSSFQLLCCCFVLFCFVLFCFVLFCFVLFCFVLFCFVLFCYVMLCYVMFCFVFLMVIMYIGQPGAIVSGGRTLTNWQFNGRYYYVTGQTQKVLNITIFPFSSIFPAFHYYFTIFFYLLFICLI